MDSFMPPLQMDADGRLQMADAMAIGAVIDKGPFEGGYSINHHHQ